MSPRPWDRAYRRARRLIEKAAKEKHEDLNLQEQELVELPREIGEAIQVQNLDLRGNQLTELPPEIGKLANLQTLALEGNQLAELPAEIGQLANLRTLTLRGNQLAELPAEIGQLANLRTVDLHGNQLAALPPEIGRLANLQHLYLEGNRLAALPPEVDRLANLQSLTLRGNRLAELPAGIGRLANLRTLGLEGNQLAALPPEIGRLANLQHLYLEGNRLAELPAEIGRLANLRTLYLHDNQLTGLPAEFGNLSERLLLRLGGNPLREPLPQLVTRGTVQLLSYQRSLLRDAEAQYEAKLVLVGEGNVGKTSLVAALQGRSFIRDRPTTHGIEREVLRFSHPDLDVDMVLNTWDFGGQELYRITHQFFFSRRALYLLVWQPRQGQEQNEVEGWLRRITLRVGEDARVIVVATHADEQIPELDYPRLKRQFGDLLVGHCAIDNCSGRGIETLRQAIAVHAARLPQMGQSWSRSWIAARDEILARPEPQIPHDEFVAVCQQHTLDTEATGTLASLLHDLGHVIYYGADEGLRDIVVLQPEWLTKAISYVLEDRPTRQAGGVLDHARLKDIWQRPQVNYASEYHPYFLRLMEKFDVSHRLPEEHKSLVGQLVPYEQPKLPWHDPGEAPDTRTLRLVCRMADVAPGLVAWLTVRNHRFSTGLHWRRGVLLAHKGFSSEALFALLDNEQSLTLTVRAPSPGYFFGILVDGLEHLVNRRWPGLSYELLVPCPTRSSGGTYCTGQFELQTLMRRGKRDGAQIDCRVCDHLYDIALLLTGFAGPTLQQQVDEILQKLRDGVDDIGRYTASIANQVRRILRVVSTEVTDCPRLFTLARTESAWSKIRFWEHQYQLTLWCEQPENEHAWDRATYDITCPKEWFDRAAPYLRLVSKTLHLVVPVASVVWSDAERVNHGIEFMSTLAELSQENIRAEPATQPASGLTIAEGAGLREFRALLLERDPSRSFGGLRRVQNPSGDFLWICDDHYPEHHPGLPDLSG
ncbi:MAG: COR domain-containing protein [Egibacteraceae bacterium]